MPMKYLIAAAAALVCHVAIYTAIRRFQWRRENFRKEIIPSVTGLYIVAYGVIGAVLGRYTPFGSDYAARLYLVAIICFGLLGLADDLLGSRAVGGFRGHFRKLLVERKLTTGASKAIGGGIVAVYLGYSSSGGRAAIWVLNAAIIALAANTINLLDLRPGRALFAYFAAMAVVGILAAGRIEAPVPVIAVTLAAAVVAYWDVRGKAMLGDVGSNTLGAVLGLTVVLCVGLVGKLVFAAAFLAVNILSERVSISKLIERQPVLRGIDSKLGVR